MKNWISAVALVLAVFLGSLASAQTALPSTTLSAALTASEKLVYVASASGMSENPGSGTVTMLYVDKEAMRVKTVAGLVIGVERGTDGSVQTRHRSGATVYYGPPSAFVQTPPSGPCTATDYQYLPIMAIPTGEGWNCTDSYWFSTRPLGPAYLEAASCQGATAALLWDHAAAGMPAAACIGTNRVKGVADFDKASDEAFHRHLALPLDFTGKLDVRVFWLSTATTGTARFGLRVDCFGAGEDLDGAVTNSTTFAATPHGTASRLVVTSQTTVTITGCAAGEVARFDFFRDGDGTSGTDDMDADARVLGIELRTRRE